MNSAELRQAARLIWEAALEAADPAVCIRNVLQPGVHGFRASGRLVDVGGRLVVIGCGKAAAGMARTIEEILDDRIAGGIVVTQYGRALPLKRIQLMEAGHPIPDASGVRAVHAIRDLLQPLSAQDVVLCLISGGGSALWPAPADGISLEEKQQVTADLLLSGATIRELNAVRKHLSAVKGGQLARWASPARVISLIISDVIGDPLDVIASGPAAPDPTTFSDALAILRKYGSQAPTSVRARLESGVRGEIPETPKPDDPVFARVENHVIANNRLLVDAAAKKARELQFGVLTLSTEIEGEAKEAGGFFAAIAREIHNSGNPIAAPACVLAAGETTVTVKGGGMGGRNQEMALAWAIRMAERSPHGLSCFASFATDGADGPTPAAGGIVDPSTCARGLALGLAPERFLRENDSFNFLKATGDLIITGPTQTNLMDLQVLLCRGGL